MKHKKDFANGTSVISDIWIPTTLWWLKIKQQSLHNNCTVISGWFCLVYKGTKEMAVYFQTCHIILVHPALLIQQLNKEPVSRGPDLHSKGHVSPCNRTACKNSSLLVFLGGFLKVLIPHFSNISAHSWWMTEKKVRPNTPAVQCSVRIQSQWCLCHREAAVLSDNLCLT